MRANSILFALFIAVISIVLGISYSLLFKKFLFDYTAIIPFWKLIATYFFLSFLITFLFLQFKRLFTKQYWVFNLLLILFTFSSILIPIQAEVFHSDEEFFPVFAIPLHFILPLFWLAFYNLINSYEKN